ncbi:calcineurin-binding protein cabin-1 [Caerostris extrusa]|uniref:Calcineurin-binding protein cabin-1 n=1 Tax=Caerostris extrusa TaxID=172846 RepID=A0AAV4SX32_CAEEX|nr:calcineurin-binding protein cabin-1 [Caerostris extrusa]
MVHVEKPRAENLQACSVAFLPVAPVFSKEAATRPNAVQAPSLLSCQAYECFDVLTSIMQASGYKVAPQTMASQHVKDNDKPINLVKAKPEIRSNPCFTNVAPRGNVGRPKKRKRKPSIQKMEALNLCKRTISTKPIVSSTIAHSIAELKVGSVASSPKMASQGRRSFATIAPNIYDVSNSRIQNLSTQSCHVFEASTDTFFTSDSARAFPLKESTKSFETSVHNRMKNNPEVMELSCFSKNHQEIETSNSNLAENKIQTFTSQLKPTSVLETAIDPSMTHNDSKSIVPLESIQTSEASINIAGNDKEISTVPASSLDSLQILQTSNDDFKITQMSTSTLMSTHIFKTSVDVCGNVHLNITEMPTSSVESSELLETLIHVPENDNFKISESRGLPSQSVLVLKSSPQASNDDLNVKEVPVKVPSVEVINTETCRSFNMSPNLLETSDLMQSLIQETESKISAENNNNNQTVDHGKTTRNISDGIFLNEANDSCSSANIDISVVEQCAKDMLEFINQKVEDMVLCTKPPVNFESLNVETNSHDFTEDLKGNTVIVKKISSIPWKMILIL